MTSVMEDSIEEKNPNKNKKRLLSIELSYIVLYVPFS